MKRAASLLTLGALAGAVALQASLNADRDTVEVAQLDATNWEQLAPGGKEVDAIYGDFVLRNRHLVAVVAKPVDGRHANLTVREVAGCLLDLTRRDAQSDQLSAFYPGGVKAYPYRAGEIVTPSGDSKSGAIKISSKGDETRPQVEVTYELAPNEPYLRITSKYTNVSPKEMTIQPEDTVRADAQKDEIVKAPEGTGEWFWFHDQFWEQAYAVEAPGFEVAINNTSKESTLRYQSTASGKRKVDLKPGESFSLTRVVYPGNDMLQVRAIAAGMRQKSTTAVALKLTTADGQPLPKARLSVKRGDESLGTINTQADGTVKTSLVPGDYSLTATYLGVDITPASGPLKLTVNAQEKAQQATLKADRWQPGLVTARITDGAGQPIPCKIEFLAQGETPKPHFGPETADFGVKSLCYAPLGELSQALPPGEYEVVISHGPEHDALFQQIAVAPGKTIEIKGKLPRVVDTTGWISTDFHSHSSPSGDNTGSQLGRVLNLLCDHIEYAPCTEHNRIDTYQPHIDRLQVGRFIGSCTGMELTGLPLPLNHQNAFPLVMKPHLQNGGGPTTDADVETQVERLAKWDDSSEKLVQVNHADFGWLIRDKNGDRTADEGNARILPFVDVYEVHPVPDILTLDPYLTASQYKGNNRVFNWLQLLNQGMRMRGVVNTDAHYNYHESGFLRNWVKSPTDEPSEVKVLDIVRASTAGAVVMSNGPFLEARVAESGKANWVISGQDVSAPSKKLTIDVRVQCPNWLDIDRVFVLVNGRIAESTHFRRETHPDRFRNGVVKFAEKLEVTLERDSHVIVACGGEKSTLGKVHGPQWGKDRPAAFTNAIFVDVDGNDFQPNSDTLGAPLPVKYLTPKK